MGKWALHEEHLPGAEKIMQLQIMQLQLCTEITSENVCLARVGYLGGARGSGRESWGEQVVSVEVQFICRKQRQIYERTVATGSS